MGHRGTEKLNNLHEIALVVNDGDINPEPSQPLCSATPQNMINAMEMNEQGDGGQGGALGRADSFDLKPNL